MSSGVVVGFRLVVVFLRWVKTCRVGGSKELAVGCRSNKVDIRCGCGWGQAEGSVGELLDPGGAPYRGGGGEVPTSGCVFAVGKKL